MLRASALFYAVTVALLIGMVSGSLVLLVHFRDVEMEHWLAQERATSNARSAIRLACVRDLTDAPAHALDLFGDGQDSAFVQATAYGLFDHVAVRAHAGDDEVEVAAFIGPRHADAHVLVLGGNGTGGISLGGDTRITGDIIVPNADVRRAYIEGRPFSGEHLVDGAIQASPRGSLVLEADALERMRTCCRQRSPVAAQLLSLMQFRSKSDTDDVFRECPVVDLHGLRKLEAMDLHGPLVLRSSDTLEIGGDVALDMVLVEAPFIVITTMRPSVMQCFAELGVSVGPGVVLEYPSALVVVPPDDQAGLFSITIDSAAVVEGAVVAATDGRDPDTRTTVSVGRYAIVRGEVFCDGLVEQRGTVEGTVRANGLFLRTASSTYRGHLLDAILQRERPGVIMGALARRGTDHQDILQWTAPLHRRRVRA